MAGTCIDTIRIQGFKSLENCTLSLGRINIVLGPNGVGKSSFLQVFSLLQQAASGRLQRYLSKQGGPNALLCYGSKKTSQLAFSLTSPVFSYSCVLEPTLDGRFVFRQESLTSGAQRLDFEDPGYFESALCSAASTGYAHIASAIRSWRPVHFNDTGDLSPIKQRQSISDNLYLRHDGSNIAPVLFRLKMEFPDYYARIVSMVHLIAPFFQDFLLRPCPDNHSQIELEWIDKEDDTPFKAHLLSDGTLRFICLATLLQLPPELCPDLILIDEPELGLHPFAIKVLAAMLKTASHFSQVVVSTQSAELVEEYTPEDIVIAERIYNRTVLYRPDSKELTDWLEEYTLGELWEKNLLGGKAWQHVQ